MILKRRQKQFAFANVRAGWAAMKNAVQQGGGGFKGLMNADTAQMAKGMSQAGKGLAAGAGKTALGIGAVGAIGGGLGLAGLTSGMD